ncbi:formate--tetrahydrofolate ligase, partial [Paracoccus aerius]
MTDIQIARAARKLPIDQIAARLDLAEGDILRYGHDKAKISHDTLARLADRP